MIFSLDNPPEPFASAAEMLAWAFGLVDRTPPAAEPLPDVLAGDVAPEVRE